MKIGLIREYKSPPDRRVAISPQQCAYLADKFDLEICVESSPIRCFTDEEYKEVGMRVVNELPECDVYLGVKEVPIDRLRTGGTYFFFSHTIKKQSYNRKLLQALIDKKVRMIDYEVLKDEKGKRVIAFGHFAGMVGAHNGVMALGKKTGAFDIPRMNSFFEYTNVKAFYKTLNLPYFKTVLTGNGRVGQGALEVLLDLGISQVSPEDFLEKTYDKPVFTQLEISDYAKTKDKSPFKKQRFYANPESFESKFISFTKVADLFINGIYWDNRAPRFFTIEDIEKDSFKIKVIADVTCDIAPISSVPTTIKASTIKDPVFGFDRKKKKETVAYLPGTIDMMTIDNLPSELPRDASSAFGEMFINYVLEGLLNEQEGTMITGATITNHGALTEPFYYLENYLKGLE